MSDFLGPCLRGVLLAMIVADEDVDPDEIAAAEEAYREFTGHGLPDGELAREAAEARSQGRTPQEVLGCLPKDLAPSAKAKVLTAAFRVASADGFVLEEEDELLRAVAKAIGMGADETRTVLSRLVG
jgi:uncharacterized tellurite resistance protein B-like protein